VLVKNEIITNPKVLKCGQYLSKQKGYLRQRIQCDKIKLCPRCKYRTAPERIQKIISEQKKCLDSQKNLFSVSISNKYEKVDSLSIQVQKSRKSIAKFKNSKKWRGIREDTIATVFETTFGQENGYHHHCHMIISTSSNITKTKVKEAFIPYWKKETGTYLNIIQLDEPTMYLEKIDPKVKSMIAESNNELEQRFSKEELEGILHSYETDELPEHPITKEETVRVLRDMYENQSYYKLR
jgi:hypothetical protein